MAKKQFLAKLNKNDYNNELEGVLEEKSFTSDTKSLLLSMLYKIETSYKDYEKVKRNVMKKNYFIEQIIATIKYCCNEIKLVEPNSEEGKNFSGEIARIEKNNIIAFPTEYALLTGIAQKIPLEFFSNSLLNNEIKKILELGYISSINEVITDFDGWTWNTSKISSNILLYNNIEILLGHEFIEEWKLGKKNIKNVINKAVNMYKGENINILINEISKIIAKGFVIDYTSEVEDYLKEFEKLKKSFNIINDTSKYLNTISEEKKKLNTRIKEIDKLLLDNNLLKQQYIKENEMRTLENKLFSIRQYLILLENEKNGLIRKMNQYNEDVKPAVYISKKEKMKKELDKYELIFNAQKETETFEKLVINFQRIFLKVWEIQIEKAISKKEIIDLIYILRYYKNLKVGDKHIKDIDVIKNELVLFEKTLLFKAINLEVFSKLINNALYMVEVLSRIFDTNIIDLEEIALILKVKDNKVILNIYDGEILDRTLKLDYDIKVIQIKENKKIKLFS